MEQVVLVDRNDNTIGLMEKLAAHMGSGTLHRAVSVLLYRKKKGKIEVLIQQRGPAKPLWPYFWSNTVCTHPRDGEAPIDCAARRLKEEMGIEMSPGHLVFVEKLLYQAKYNDELSENEVDHVFIGEWDGKIVLNPEEAAASDWKQWDELIAGMKKNPSKYTPWFMKLVIEEKIQPLLFMNKLRNGLKKIIIVKPRGFCAGVERAVNTVDLLLKKYGSPLYVRHHIVHNDHVVKEFEKRGVIFVEDLDLVPEGAKVVFSAHGSPPGLYELAKKRHLQIVDATCPLVTKVHVEAKQYAADGFFIFYVGHKNHPETVGVLGEVAPTQIVLLETIADAWNIQPPQQEKLVILNQTTLSVDDTKELIGVLKERFPVVVTPVGKDICYATQNRQDAVKALANVVDLVLVVGSPTSSNSNRLRDVAEQNGVKVYLVSDKEKIDPAWLKGVNILGVTSGASVPETLVTALVALFIHPGVEVEELTLVDESRIHFLLPKELNS